MKQFSINISIIHEASRKCWMTICKSKNILYTLCRFWEESCRPWLQMQPELRGVTKHLYIPRLEHILFMVYSDILYTVHSASWWSFELVAIKGVSWWRQALGLTSTSDLAQHFPFHLIQINGIMNVYGWRFVSAGLCGRAFHGVGQRYDWSTIWAPY